MLYYFFNLNTHIGEKGPPFSRCYLPSQKVRRALVAFRVLVQVLLVVLFGVEPLACRDDLSNDRLALVVLLLDLGSDPLCDLLLLGRVIEDGRTVLGTDVRALGVDGGRIVHPVEELDQVGVVDLVVGGVLDLESLSVLSGSSADLCAIDM